MRGNRLIVRRVGCWPLRDGGGTGVTNMIEKGVKFISSLSVPYPYAVSFMAASFHSIPNLPYIVLHQFFFQLFAVCSLGLCQETLDLFRCFFQHIFGFASECLFFSVQDSFYLPGNPRFVVGEALD